MVQFLGFKVDSMLLFVPDGVTDIADIAQCEVRFTLSRELAEVEGGELGVEDIVRPAVGELATTVVGGEDVPSVVANNVVREGDWCYKSVRLPVGTILRVVQRNEVIGGAVIVNNGIMVVSSLRAPNVVGRSFSSPSAAAAAVLDFKSANGWVYWQVMLSNDGDSPVFVSLDVLRSDRDRYRQFAV